MVARHTPAVRRATSTNPVSRGSFFIYLRVDILVVMTTKTSSHTQPDSPLAIIALILGALSFTGPGLLLGIPAIILGIIALKKRLPGRNLSIIGLVLGAISTFLSLLLFALFLLFVVWAAEHDYQQNPHSQPGDHRTFDSNRT